MGRSVTGAAGGWIIGNLGPGRQRLDQAQDPPDHQHAPQQGKEDEVRGSGAGDIHHPPEHHAVDDGSHAASIQAGACLPAGAADAVRAQVHQEEAGQRAQEQRNKEHEGHVGGGYPVAELCIDQMEDQQSGAGK